MNQSIIKLLKYLFYSLLLIFALYLGINYRNLANQKHYVVNVSNKLEEVLYHINTKYVDTVNNNQVTLQTLSTVPIAQGKAREIKQKYLAFQMEGE